MILGSSIWYKLPENQGLVELPAEVLNHIQKYQQKNSEDKEAGGQLFGKRVPEGHLRVAAITGPRPTDKCSRASYKADHKKEQAEIEEHYSRGLHYLGDWHTHPQEIAEPSDEDIKCIKEIYSRSVNAANGWLMLIAGTGPLNVSLSVTFCNDKITTLYQPFC